MLLSECLSPAATTAPMTVTCCTSCMTSKRVGRASCAHPLLRPHACIPVPHAPFPIRPYISVILLPGAASFVPQPQPGQASGGQATLVKDQGWVQGLAHTYISDPDRPKTDQAPGVVAAGAAAAVAYSGNARPASANQQYGGAVRQYGSGTAGRQYDGPGGRGRGQQQQGQGMTQGGGRGRGVGSPGGRGQVGGGRGRAAQSGRGGAQPPGHQGQQGHQQQKPRGQQGVAAVPREHPADDGQQGRQKRQAGVAGRGAGGGAPVPAQQPTQPQQHQGSFQPHVSYQPYGQQYSYQQGGTSYQQDGGQYSYGQYDYQATAAVTQGGAPPPMPSAALLSAARRPPPPPVPSPAQPAQPFAQYAPPILSVPLQQVLPPRTGSPRLVGGVVVPGQANGNMPPARPPHMRWP